MLGAPGGCACPGRMWLSRPWGTFMLVCGPKAAQPAPASPYMWSGAHMCTGALFPQAPCLACRPVCTGAPYVHRGARRPIRAGALYKQAPYLPRRPICPGALIAQAPTCAQPPSVPRRPYVAICALIKVSHVSDRLVCRDYHLILCTR